MRQPIKFLPYLKTTDWGGEGISRFKGLKINCKNIGESWELSAEPGCESIVMDGTDCGMTLADMVTKYKENLVGQSVYTRYGNEFPLVVKFIDDHNRLWVQMHPRHAGPDTTPCRYSPQPTAIPDLSQNLLRSEFCHINKEVVRGQRHLTNPHDSFMGLVCVEGNGSLKVDGISTSVRQGESLLLPAHTDNFDVEGTLSLLTIVIPTLLDAD